MLVVDKVVEEARHMLLPNELQSMSLPDGMTQAPGLTTRDAFAISEDLCLLGNGERPQSLQLEYPHKTCAVELIESILTNYHELFRKVCLSSPLSIRDLYASTCPQIILMFTEFRALTLITTPTLSPQITLQALRFPACPLRHPYCLPLVLFNSPPGSRRRPKSFSHCSSNSLLARLTSASIGLGG